MYQVKQNSRENEENKMPPKTTSATDIAIIGMAGRFPGADNVQEFWENIENKVESISFFTDDDLTRAGVSPSLLANKNYIRAKGCLNNASLFDAKFFNFAEYEAKILDPQFRLLLQTAWEALEDAAYTPGSASENIGVFAGSSIAGSYYINNLMSNDNIRSQSQDMALLTHNAQDFLTTMLAYKLNLTGPCITVQTACSTSLVAICTACEYLVNSKCDIALAGGASVTTPLNSGYLYQKGMIGSSDGHCRAFDAEANGTVPGNGLGLVVLKKLDRALADHDHIHAVIKGFAINNDGNNKMGFTSPSIEGQQKVVQAALDMARIDLSQLSYIEAHATGTRLGDPIEAAALVDVFKSSNQSKAQNPIALGTLKPNIGHLDIASGVAGVIKTALALKHKTLPPTINFERLNPEIDFSDTPFYINKIKKEWCKIGPHSRLAGVSSFGIGGTNAHLILEEAPKREPSKNSNSLVLFVLSAKRRSALIRQRRSLADYLEKNTNVDLNDIAFTLQVGRQTMKERFACICGSREEAIEKLRNLNEQTILEMDHNMPSTEYDRLLSAVQQWLTSDNSTFNWSDLYINNSPYRVPLPTYPFEGREYWIHPDSIAPLSNQQQPADPKKMSTEALEIAFKDIFKSFLGTDRIDSIDDFYDLGGDSLLTLQVADEIKKKLGIEISAEVLEKNSSPRNLTKFIQDSIHKEVLNDS